MMKSRADLGICLGYLLVAAAFFKIAVLDTATDAKNLTIADLITYYYPMMKYGFSRLRHGDIPLWNPHQACGTPFIASTHFGLLYPPYAVFLVMRPELAINVNIVLHLTVACVGMYLLCRHLTMARASSFVAGLVYAYQGSVMIKVYFPEFLAAAAWIPFVFLFVDRLLCEPSWRRCATLATVIAISVLGEHGVQFTYFEFLALIPWLLVRSVHLVRSRGRAKVMRAYVRLALAGASGASAALVRLIPTAEFVSHSWRSPGVLGMEAASVMAISPGAYIRNLLDPEPGPDLLRQVYVGVVPLALAVTGLVRWRKRSVSLPVATAGIGAVIYAFGPRTALYRVVSQLPAGNWFRGPDRALIICSFAIALLGGAGIDTVLPRGTGTGGRGMARLLVPVAALAIIPALNRVLAQAHGAGLVATYVVVGVALIATVGLLESGRVPGAAAVAALGALVVLDLGHAQRHDGLLPSHAGDYFGRLEPTFAEIRRRQGLARTYIWASFDRDDPLSFLSDVAKAGLNHDIWMATDYEPLSGRRIETYMDALGPVPFPVIGPLGYRPFLLSDENLPLVELMGIRFFMLDAGHEERFVARAPRLTARWTRLLLKDGVSLYEDPGAMQRCFVVGHVEVEPNEARLLDRLKHEDLTKIALVEERVDMDPARESSSSLSETRAEIARYDEDRVAIDTTAAERGFLVLTDQYDPGWQATVDGMSTRIYRTDYLFRGIPLPPGRHRVELTYRPSSMIYGAIGTLLGVVTIAVLFRFDRRRTPARS